MAAWQQPIVLGLLAHSRSPSSLVGATDSWGRTPLHLAAKAGNSLALAALDTSAALHQRDLFGRTALHLAAMSGHVATISDLRSHTLRFHPGGQEAWDALERMEDQHGRVYSQLIPTPAMAGGPGLEPGAGAAGSGGGWNVRSGGVAQRVVLGEVVADGAGRCEVDVVEGMLSPAEFVEGYLKVGRPVLMRGATLSGPTGFKETTWQGWRRSMERDRFLKAHGSRSFAVSAIPYGEIFGTRTENMTANAYAAGIESRESAAGGSGGGATAVPYIFHSVSSAADGLMGGFNLFPGFLSGSEKARQLVDVTTPKAVQFFLGAAGSGAPVHFHCDAWNTIAHGSKRWFISPPSEAIFSKKPILQWLEEDYPSLRESKSFWEVEQRAGDVLYVPCEWGHAVLNVEDTIGLAVEFKYRYTDGT